MNRKRVMIYLAALALSVLGISLYGGPVTWIFFRIVLLIPVMCLVYIFCVIFSFKVYQRTDGRDMVCGDPADFYITMTNEGFFSFSALKLSFYSSFSTVADIQDSVVYELAPQSSLVKKTRLVCKYRGEYEVGLKEIVVTDVLGMFSVTWSIKEPLNMIVAPALIRLTGLKSGDVIEQTEKDNPALKTEPDIPVREYTQGDDPRFIHWKMSAVTGKLMLRERTGEEKSGLAIIMDPMRVSEHMHVYLPVENRMIEIVLALSLYYMEKNIPVDIYTGTSGEDHHEVRRADDVERLYEYMRAYSFGGEPVFMSMLGNLLSGSALAGCRMLILIVHEWDGEKSAMQERLNILRLPVRVYIAESTQEQSSYAEGTGTSGKRTAVPDTKGPSVSTKEGILTDSLEVAQYPKGHASRDGCLHSVSVGVEQMSTGHLTPRSPLGGREEIISVDTDLALDGLL